MRYIFGTEKAKSTEEAFTLSQMVCPFCKSEANHTSISKIKDGKTIYLQECACGGIWQPRKPTKENLEKFDKLVNHITNN